MEQNEVDSLMQEINKETGAAPPGPEGDIGWDDVKDELEKSRQGAPAAEVSDPDFSELQKPAAGKGGFDLDFILDIPLSLTVELGRTEVSAKEVVGLKKGDVIMLERYRVDPLDVYVEGVQKLRAYPGVYKGNTAIQIAGTIEGKEAQYYGTE